MLLNISIFFSFLWLSSVPWCVMCWLLSCVRLFATPWSVTFQGPLGIFPGKNTGVDCHFLLQGIFLTQGLNPGLLHCRWILYHLSHQRSPRILEWIAYPFSSGSFRPRNQTAISRIAGRLFTNWAIREAWQRKYQKKTQYDSFRW